MENFYVFLTITMEIFFKKMSSRERNKFVDLLELVHKIFGWFLVFWRTVVSNRDVKCFRRYYSSGDDLLAVSLSYEFEQKSIIS